MYTFWVRLDLTTAFGFVGEPEAAHDFRFRVMSWLDTVMNKG
jgi:hypothetical protein